MVNKNLLIFTFLFIITHLVFADNERHIQEAFTSRTESPPDIDGIIEAGEWGMASVISDFAQYDSDYQVVPSQIILITLVFCGIHQSLTVYH
ncbi:MAG: hypothetical protein ABR597_01940 [Bacteroidales bacterium]